MKEKKKGRPSQQKGFETGEGEEGGPELFLIDNRQKGRLEKKKEWDKKSLGETAIKGKL